MSSPASSADGEITFAPLTAADLPFLLEIRNECRACLHDDREFRLEEAEAWFAARKPEFWVVHAGPERVGYFRTSDRSAANRSLCAGADIHRRHRGRGLGFRAWCAFLDWQFGTSGLEKVALEVLATNGRARALYDKLGFVVEGVKRREVLRDGAWIDSVVMSMLREEWAARPWAGPAAQGGVGRL